uniref:Sulfotransferase n=1 Tax=Leersia perrieri TaxID=77586 RepID=A0A0D9WNX6_9ORYZ
MASEKPSAPVGPIPFKDMYSELDTAIPEQLPERLSHLADMLSSLPSKTEVNLGLTIYHYQGFWLHDNWVLSAVALQRSFVPRPDDVIVASLPKCGTTWLLSLAFATMARRAYPPAAADHPLRRISPHQCVPFLDVLGAIPSPRLMNTHMPLTMLPNTYKVVYVCREPKDMVVSFWHFFQQTVPGVTFAETFEAFCDGANISGPFWDHNLGYWRASIARPNSVLFLRYEWLLGVNLGQRRIGIKLRESWDLAPSTVMRSNNEELLRDPAKNVRELARFVGLPFSEPPRPRRRLAFLSNLRSLEVNRTGYVDSRLNLRRDTLFRKGVTGDWVNYMTPEMACRLDDIVEEKLGAAGFSFKFLSEIDLEPGV